MTVVKDLVHTGITICATIHSPTPYCFALFDRLILLLRGRVVYFGDRGRFESLLPGFSQSCPRVYYRYLYSRRVDKYFTQGGFFLFRV